MLILPSATPVGPHLQKVLSLESSGKIRYESTTLFMKYFDEHDTEGCILKA